MKAVFALTTCTTFLLVGCATFTPIDDTIDDTDDTDDVIKDDDNQDDDDDDNTDPDPDPTFAPAEGIWTVLESDLVEDGCDLEDFAARGEPGSQLDLEPVASTSFLVTFFGVGDESGGGEELNCDLDEDLRYECTTSQTTNDTPADYGLNAEILVNLTASGFFDSEDEMFMNSDIDLDCSGPDCGWVSFFLGTEFPCSMQRQSSLESD